MPAPLPWFPFYVDAYETDEKVRRLTYEERGVYLSMLCWQWREGSLPGRPQDVAVIMKVRTGVVTKLMGLFFSDDGGDGGRVSNRKMEQIRVQQVARLGRDRDKAAAYRERMRVRHGDDTALSPHRSRGEIQREIQKSLKASARAEHNGHSDDSGEIPE